MLTQTDFVCATEIIDGLNIPEQFGVNESSDAFDEYDLELQLRDINIGSFSIDNGVSKAVVIPNNFNFVIKIPFNGIKYYQWDYAEGYGEEYFEPFQYADAPDCSDYCWDELIKIEQAYEAGFGCLFPQTAFVKEHNGKRFYIQEKVCTYSQACRSGETPAVSENSRNKAKDMDYHYSPCHVEWRAAVIEFYGEEFWKNFVNWDDANCVGILIDMHSNNYGYTTDGRPVILDASGFRED